MLHSSRHLRRYALATAVSLGIATTPLAAQQPAQVATEQLADFHIPAGSLGDTLNRIASQSGRIISVDPALVRGKQAPAIAGRMGAEQAVRQALAGSDLELVTTASGAWSLVSTVDAVSNEGTIVTGALSVEGRATDPLLLGNDSIPPADRAYRSAQSGSYMSRETIERYRGNQAGDIFKSAPGILNGDNRNSGALDLNIRGMQGMGRVATTIDGSLQETTVYRGYSGVAGRTYVDPDLIGGVSIEKGPTAGVEGVGATGGVVSMRTLVADDIITGDKDWGIRVRGGFNDNSSSVPATYTTGGLYDDPDNSRGYYVTGCGGGRTCTVQQVPDVSVYGNPDGLDRPSFGEPTGGYGSIAAAKKWEHLELVAAYARRHNGNYHAGSHGNAPSVVFSERQQTYSDGGWEDRTYYSFDADLNRFRADEQVLNTSVDNTSYLFKATWRPSVDQSLELGHMNFESWFGELMPSSIIRADGALQSPLSHADVDTFTARYRWNPDSELIDLKANYWRTLLDNRILTAFCSGSLCIPIPYGVQAARWGMDLSNTARWSGGWGDLAVQAGLTHSKDNNVPDYDFEYCIEWADICQDATDTYGTRDGKREESGAFVSTEWLPFDWLKVDASLRYTRFETVNRLADETSALRSFDGSGSTPIVALTWMPMDGLQVYLRYAEALRMPSLFESTTSFSIAPTADLRPEHARNREVGINYLRDGLFRGDDSARLKLAYFDNHVVDYITRTSLRGSSDWALRNIDFADFSGYELSLEYRTQRFHAELSGTYYTNVEFCYQALVELRPNLAACSDGGPGYANNHIPPTKSASLGGGVNFFDRRLQLGGRVTYVGDRPDTANSASNSIDTVEWDPYTLIDIYAEYVFSDRFKLEFGVDNLMDRYYMDALTLGLMASSGRTMHTSVTLNF